MSLYAQPLPATKLGRHRQLAPNAGVHVSPIALGGMSIGDAWSSTMKMGVMDKEGSFKLLDAYFDAGGNFIDTANNYQDETSEMFIGEWMEKRGNRDQIVLATKYSTCWKRYVPKEELPQRTQYVGNSTKSLHVSVHASLKKLRTDYIDILYLGVSDTPAWVVSEANTYARLAGKTPFIIYQGPWNIMQRDVERDILPMCIKHGMAFAPWNVLAAGKIRTDAEEQKRLESGEGGRAIFGDWKRSESERKVCLAIEKVAEEVGAKSITSVAIAWAMQKFPYVFPIIGGRKIEHLHANIEALEIALTPEQIKFLDDIVPFDKGFPYNMFGDGSDYSLFYKSAGHFDKWPAPQAIRPAKQ